MAAKCRNKDVTISSSGDWLGNIWVKRRYSTVTFIYSFLVCWIDKFLLQKLKKKTKTTLSEIFVSNLCPKVTSVHRANLRHAFMERDCVNLRERCKSYQKECNPCESKSQQGKETMTRYILQPAIHDANLVAVLQLASWIVRHRKHLVVDWKPDVTNSTFFGFNPPGRKKQWFNESNDSPWI